MIMNIITNIHTNMGIWSIAMRIIMCIPMPTPMNMSMITVISRVKRRIVITMTRNPRYTSTVIRIMKKKPTITATDYLGIEVAG